jgi:hypothetical protein
LSTTKKRSNISDNDPDAYDLGNSSDEDAEIEVVDEGVVALAALDPEVAPAKSNKAQSTKGAWPSVVEANKISNVNKTGANKVSNVNKTGANKIPSTNKPSIERGKIQPSTNKPSIESKGKVQPKKAQPTPAQLKKIQPSNFRDGLHFQDLTEGFDVVSILPLPLVCL